MSISIPIYSSGGVTGGLLSKTLTNGLWHVNMTYSLWMARPRFTVGERKEAGDKMAVIEKVVENESKNEIDLYYRISDKELDITQTSQSKVGAGAIALVALIAGGLGLLFLTVNKVEKIIETPAGQAAVVGGSLLLIIILLLGLFAFYRYARGKIA